MKIVINDKYEVKTNNRGYMIRRRSGSQWKTEGYYDTLREAVADVFEKSIRTETDEFIVDFANVETFHKNKDELIGRIEEIRDEILGGLSCNN